MTRTLFTASFTALLIALLTFTQSGHVYADHCGGAASVDPISGPAGTAFVFRTNVGAPSDLSIFHDGRPVRQAYLPRSGDVSYVIRTSQGDDGTWRIRAAVRGHEVCYAEATFTVGGLPETSTLSTRSPSAKTDVFVVGGLGGLAFALTLRRWRRARSA